MDTTEVITSADLATTRINGTYSIQLYQLFKTVKDRMFGHCDTISCHFPHDLRPSVEQLWQEAHEIMSVAIDENFKVLLEDLETEEKFTELEELKIKYSKRDSLAWKYSKVPQKDSKDFIDSSARDFLSQYEETYQQVQDETQQLLQIYEKNAYKLAQLNGDTETRLIDIESVLNISSS